MARAFSFPNEHSRKELHTGRAGFRVRSAGVYSSRMTQRAKVKQTMEQWQWKTVSCLIRLAERYGQYPSSREIAKEMRCTERWMKRVLQQMRDEGLTAIVGSANASGWIPTPEAAQWRGLEMPRLQTSTVPPRSVRNAGVGAIRAWNKKRRLVTRAAAAQILDRGMVFDPDQLMSEQPLEM